MVAIIGILAFRKPLTALLGRESVTLGVGKEGVTLAASATAATIQAESKPAVRGLGPETEKRLETVRNIDVVPIVQEQESLIRADLENLGVLQPEKVELLVKHLAVTQLLLRAEHTYRIIFGSQIDLLKSLNLSGTATRVALSQFYDKAKAQFPELYAKYSFDQYLQFLLSQGLVMQTDTEHFDLTIAGKEFLKWMTEAGATENKPF